MPASNFFSGPGDSSAGSGIGEQPLPPLPKLNTSGSTPDADNPTDPFQATFQALKPVKDAVDTINNAIVTIAQSGLVTDPSILANLSSMASQLVPLAAQNLLKPGALTGSMPPPSQGPIPPPGIGSGGLTSAPPGAGGPIPPMQ